MPTPSADQEVRRLAELRAYQVLDTPAEPAFDEITKLAAYVCGTPSAVVTFIDEKRQWFKSKYGFGGVTETERSIAFCSHTIESPELLVVLDATLDPRFAANPAVIAPPRVRFYAGAPLVMPSGNILGALAVFDYRARSLDEGQRDALGALAHQVVAQLELRRRLAEQHVLNLEEKERFELAARATNDAVWDWNLVTDQIWWNDGMRTLFGYGPEQQPSIDEWTASVHPEDEPRVTAKLYGAIKSGQDFWSDNYRFKRSDGRWADIFDRGWVMRDASGKPVRMVGAMLDVTERRQLEDQLRQSQKMDAIGQLSGGIAHDFNNLLTVIQVNAALLARASKAPELRDHTAAITEATERAAALTRQLLMVSRRQIMSPQVIDVSEVVTNLTRMLHRIVGEHITLEANTTPSMPHVSADVGMLEQVLLNLVVNARDAMPKGGTLTLSTGHVQQADAVHVNGFDVAPGPYVWIAVSDTGSGILPEHLPRIFEPFFTTKEVGRGTGLGLATAYGIVRQHQGWIDVQSVPEHGTTFRMYLPVTSEHRGVSSMAGPIDADLPRGSETILVVEDEPALRHLVLTLLSSCGYTVLAASSGVAALELWQAARDRIELVLTDMVMPGGMSGRELAERLRADVPQLPVIYTSGYSPDTTGAGEALVEGTNYLPKPYQPLTLAQTVRNRLDKRTR